MIAFRENSSGGRTLIADTPIGKAHVEWDASGTLVFERIEIRSPSASKHQALIDARRPICEACPEAERITSRGVKCRDCGCGLVSFIHGRCKLGKWDTP